MKIYFEGGLLSRRETLYVVSPSWPTRLWHRDALGTLPHYDVASMHGSQDVASLDTLAAILTNESAIIRSGWERRHVASKGFVVIICILLCWIKVFYFVNSVANFVHFPVLHGFITLSSSELCMYHHHIQWLHFYWRPHKKHVLGMWRQTTGMSVFSLFQVWPRVMFWTFGIYWYIQIIFFLVQSNH
jgi:hypothetical protein